MSIATKSRTKPPIQRGDAYYCPICGQAHPRVTSVLQEIAKPALIQWAAREAAKAALDDPSLSVEEAASANRRIKDRAANLGSLVHSWTEAYAVTGSLDPGSVPEEARGYCIAFLRWLEAEAPTVLASECIVTNCTYGYGGTADAIVRDQAGHVAIVDYKTGKNIYEFDHGLQVRAYGLGEHFIDRKNHERLAIPPIEYAVIIHLRPDGTYSRHELDADFESFRAYLHVFRTRKGLPCPPACWCSRPEEA